MEQCLVEAGSDLRVFDAESELGSVGGISGCSTTSAFASYLSIQRARGEATRWAGLVVER